MRLDIRNTPCSLTRFVCHTILHAFAQLSHLKTRIISPSHIPHPDPVQVKQSRQPSFYIYSSICTYHIASALHMPSISYFSSLSLQGPQQSRLDRAVETERLCRRFFLLLCFIPLSASFLFGFWNDALGQSLGCCFTYFGGYPRPLSLYFWLYRWISSWWIWLAFDCLGLDLDLNVDINGQDFG